MDNLVLNHMLLRRKPLVNFWKVFAAFKLYRKNGKLVHDDFPRTRLAPRPVTRLLVLTYLEVMLIKETPVLYSLCRAYSVGLCRWALYSGAWEAGS